ncbi:MAG TPA: hypothetical protein PKO25_03300 [Spirochaetota bacterium]|jgi:hypothetical protein|nr:hypothetical protein [Spirochaetota bacterium]OPZ37221.1 MAG: hypothetical protein BWY96_01780 [Spirochaetes bacterium ADurb.BinA120]HNU90878.1 hypothetical protein [Spirochaetota bacterium]HPI15443.1 hypothetical protein [Spirochaetota bacterium]HPV97233.1 hypothetical protein [Spirochaetota bacterium]
MKRFNSALAQFMTNKAIRLNEVINVPEHLFFIDEDRDEIMAWNRARARQTWRRLKNNVIKLKSAGINPDLCIFCIYNNFKYLKRTACKDCGYGRRHGLCDSKTRANDYATIMRAFGYAEENPLRFFTDSYYRRLIVGIEKELGIYWWMLW